MGRNALPGLLLGGLVALATMSAPARAATGDLSADEMNLIGQERALVRHLNDNAEQDHPIASLLAFGRRVFNAMWTEEDGGGRPMTKVQTS